ncbi:MULTISPECIES: type II RES/Xre toxin-antitoxin system antitoxin [Cysteiniphilum]|uniref:Antitoxin n=1 Tax=Cysteiniphilum litorale TaxID=2056700 RepID=A0A8J2Z4P6_9GAMM|nr:MULTISPECIES: antitoxin Xre/MbcA/ParS toxin-binding domain-containing protein [Cysteiniphilum]GGF97994.1 antitoxin [Cysteiniphilum litorale]
MQQGNQSNQNNFWDAVGIPSRGERLYQAIHEGFSCEVFSKLADISGIEKNQLAKITTIAPASLNRRYKAGFFTEAESDRLYRYAEVYKSALNLFEGHDQKALHWLMSPVNGLGGRKPIEMLRTSAETKAVLDLIGRLEHGVFV